MSPTKIIKIALIEKGLTGKALAQKIGRNHCVVSQTIQCRRRLKPTRELIASALGMPYGKIWTDEKAA